MEYKTVVLKVKNLMALGVKGIGILFLAYVGAVMLFVIGIGIFAFANGKFEKFWAMLMSV